METSLNLSGCRLMRRCRRGWYPRDVRQITRRIQNFAFSSDSTWQTRQLARRLLIERPFVWGITFPWRPASRGEALLRGVEQTIASSVQCTGIGLHSGKPVDLVLAPAAAGTGILFVRTDAPQPVRFPARAEWVTDTTLATTLGNEDARLSTIEHMVSALRGITHRTVNKEPKWRHRGTQLTSGYEPKTQGERKPS